MVDQGPTSWIRLPDFAELSLWISVVNTTTHMPIPEGFPVELSEMEEKELTLRLPIRSCAQGHFLNIRIRMTKKLPWNSKTPAPSSVVGSVDEIEFTAKVVEEQPLDKISKAVSLSMYQFDEARWNQMIANIQRQQREINQVVSNIKG